MNMAHQSSPELTLPPISQNRFIDRASSSSRRSSNFDGVSQRKSRHVTTHHCLRRRSISQNNEKSVKIPFQIHRGFTLDEQNTIKKAIQIIAKRLFKPEILQNMYRYCGRKGFCFTLDVWQRSNLPKHSINHGTYFLLEYQLMCLKAKSENDEFPVINIRSLYEENNVSGRGLLKSVSCISNGSEPSVNGQFEVHLNRYHFQTSTENDSNAVDWAGVIVHEMLHNLGHNHHNGDYTDRWQINVFTKCFEYNGNY